eukprot:6491039-Amphidinium_carterae.2
MHRSDTDAQCGSHGATDEKNAMKLTPKIEPPINSKFGCQLARQLVVDDTSIQASPTKEDN